MDEDALFNSFFFSIKNIKTHISIVFYFWTINKKTWSNSVELLLFCHQKQKGHQNLLRVQHPLKYAPAKKLNYMDKIL